ncbi:MAG: dicarboxylate/amino acid:cation symporter [Planctomycetota bacterium]|nr:dicarboxylate/amino acid:cation symporter [Planctomycetota bacterium]MDA1178290.1 dicarboxylate/amino acid:cation symporter [Planctomycetota bacterium]
MAGLLVGATAGLLANQFVPRQLDGSVAPGLLWIAKNIAEPLGQVFLRLIFMVVVPLVFSALALGVAQIGDVRRLGRMGVNTLLLTLVFSGASVAIGLGLANGVQPGLRLSAEKRAELRESFSSAAATAVDQAKRAKSVRDTLLDIIPKNPLQEMVGSLDGSSPGGGMLAVMFFSLVVGVSMATIPERAAPLMSCLESIFEVSMVIIGFAMRLAPFGVAGLMFSVTALLGLDIVTTLFWYVVVVVLGLAAHLLIVYSVMLYVVAKTSPRDFFGSISEVILTAFATSSSSVTLPTALRVAEQDLKLRTDVSRFVLTVGATANQNGTALYEGVTVLFLAQVFGVDLTLTQQVSVVLMSVLAGIGTAGVPGGSLPLVVLVLQSVGVPGEGIGIILGVDRLLDMCRTTVNVVGDLVVATCVNRLEVARAS